MNTKNIREHHLIVFEKMGIDTSKGYEVCVSQLISRLVELSKEVHETEKERFARELFNLKTYRTN